MNAHATAVYRTTGGWFYENAGCVTGKVLDVGCGSKPYHRMFPDLEWVGLDMRPVGDIVADMHEIPCEDASFDTVLCTDALHYSIQPRRVFEEMWRVLKPGGHLIVVAPATLPVDTGLVAITGEGMAALASAVAGKPVNAACGYGLFKSEFGPFRSRVKHAGGYPPEIQGFIDQMDKSYPCISIVATQKE